MTYVVTDACIDILDRSCIEECPVDCIYEGGRMMYIHPDECVDCGACEPACPVEAIHLADDLKPEQQAFARAAEQFFVDLGMPGGAARLGRIAADSALVSGLPPRSPGGETLP
jgi:NAD-dependent dihydropyrimidine dehydrogenase PreA subunit